jgi:Ni,Fe-hydrogenase III small subunit/formate hydrogenlyase subunit 6/NADH:ubiquinone oxidoreductase subunit I
MLGWIPRGLRQGRVTTSYPRREESAPAGYRGRIEVLDATDAEPALVELCPTRAIMVDGAGWLTLDRGRCVHCGACVQAAPGRFAFQSRYEAAARSRLALVVSGKNSELAPEPTRRALGQQARALRRSVHVRHIDCGSDGSEEWEIQALWNPYYDIQRLGYFLTAAPRHADVLLVTGPVTTAMRNPLQRTWEVMPEPKALVAVGTDACSGGLCAADELTAGGVDGVLPVDVYVPGSPPAPIAIMHGLLLATGMLSPEERAA